MRVDIFHPRRIPFAYISPAVCDFIFSASGETTIILDDRDRNSNVVSGLIFTGSSGAYRLAWSTYPGALCYNVYRLVDELDPFSEYVLIAECITDEFLDLTDPGAFFVTAITANGETPPQSSPFFGSPPCDGNLPPGGSGQTDDLCLNVQGVYDVSSFNTDPEGEDITLVSATVDNGSVSTAGTVITYTPPTDFYGTALISYTVADPCGASFDNAILVTIYDDLVLAAYDGSTCDDTPLVIDVEPLVTSGDSQTGWTITDASVDVGGSVEITDKLITFTPTASYSGPSVISYTVQGECGKEFNGTLDVTVTCGDCSVIAAMGAWTDKSINSAIGGSSATASGLNNTATCEAVGAGYSDPIFPPPSPNAATAWAQVIKTTGGNAVVCRITLDVTTSTGATNAAVQVTHGVTVVLDESLSDPAVDTYTWDFEIPAGAPQDLQLDLILTGGRLTGFGFPSWEVTAGTIEATVTFGNQP